ncbi:MAG: pyridoxal kinase PdxY [Rhodospirillales bacterium]|nr:pyridoxal kinase PdxY [Rhodospirillales bacterium]
MMVLAVAILSFQSRVVYGHVGNAAAEFVLRRVGRNVWPIDTVTFSHHPGYGAVHGPVRGATELADLIEGLAGVGVLAGCAAVLSGYLGARANGNVVLDAVQRVRALRADALFCCDPVMGDRDTGVYVEDSLIAFFRDVAVPCADIVTPNHFELELLVERPLPALADVMRAAEDVRARGPACIAVSSIMTPCDAQARPARIGALIATDEGAWLAMTRLLAHPARGAGDVFTALLLARLLAGDHPAEALQWAVSSVFSLVETTALAGSRELLLVAAQDALAKPRRAAAIERLR